MDTNHPSQRPSAATIEAGQEALARGAWEEARAAFERALGTSDSSAEIGQAEIGQAQIEAATRRGRALAETGSTLDCQVMLARGERLQGRALAAASDSSAKQHLDAALRAFVRLDMPYEAARTRLLIARTLRTLEPEVAEAEARAALAVFKNLGAVLDAESTSTLLREIESKSSKRTGMAPDPAGLTQREVEVLHLVAQGLRDKEIATRLVLSRHTVHRHIHSILTKLGLPSRTAAAAYALRHGLL
jgi:DNA-binding NarL/FixJ family response regulator